ncbi:UPF0058 family protein [Halobacteria archaeon AArc-dxtr1]|nr:UPF0058 family protein [Halobacteria archaeon AArc-dxtr1]
MRKQELIQMHMLATEIGVFISERETIPPAAFEEYDQNGVSPTAIHHSKTAHEESLQLLLNAIHESLDHTSEQATPK